jgi:hypothetical protein
MKLSCSKSVKSMNIWAKRWWAMFSSIINRDLLYRRPFTLVYSCTQFKSDWERVKKILILYNSVQFLSSYLSVKRLSMQYKFNASKAYKSKSSLRIAYHKLIYY